MANITAFFRPPREGDDALLAGEGAGVESALQHGLNHRVLPVHLDPAQVRPMAFRVFTRKHNLTIKSDGLNLLAQYIGRKCGANWRAEADSMLDEIARMWMKHCPSAILVEDSNLTPVLKVLDVPHASRNLALQRTSSFMVDGHGQVEMSAASAPELHVAKYFACIDAFSQPKYTYSIPRRHFEAATTPPSILGSAGSKTNLFRERFAVVRHRLHQHEAFRQPSFAGTSILGDQNHYKITGIKNLLGRGGKAFLLFGMLMVGTEGRYWLEDLDSKIMLDMSEAISSEGWICPGCLCLVDGIFTEQEDFHVFTIGHPPTERRERTRELLPHLDHLGMGHDRGLERDMRAAEVKHDVRIVLVKDVALDKPRTFLALRSMLSTYTDEPPLAIVLLGNFLSVAPHLNGASATIKAYFDKLAVVLEQFPSIIAKSKLIFIPGNNDPWASSFAGGASTVLPRQGLPDVFTSRIRRVCSNSVFASNPCRLSYFTQEIVIFRDEMLARLHRNAVRFPKATDTEEEVGEEIGEEVDEEERAPAMPTIEPDVATARKLVRTVVDQAHLSPFPLSVQPVFWDYDHSLRLYPLPTALILADSAAPKFEVTYEGCHVVNPPVLVGRSKACWSEYLPHLQKGVYKERSFIHVA